MNPSLSAQIFGWCCVIGCVGIWIVVILAAHWLEKDRETKDEEKDL